MNVQATYMYVFACTNLYVRTLKNVRTGRGI